MNDIKCIVWDLDDTLWEGTLLEDNEVILKKGIPEIIKELDARGILHSISSKNDYETAAARLKNLGLWQYFLFPEINWNAKSKSLKRICENLNISPSAVLFIDDSQYERDEVSSAIPAIACVDALMYTELPGMPGLSPKFITKDSVRRRNMYIEDIKRKRDEEDFSGPKEEFLKSLNIQLRIESAKEDDLPRLEELMIRTHQLNTTGLTYDYDDLAKLLRSDNYVLLIADLKDIYGSYGKIGLVLMEKLDNELRIKLLILSCRVMNRGIGTIMLNEIIKTARDASLKLTADFKHTQKNRIMYITLKFANFTECEKQNENGVSLLSNDLTVVSANPVFINIYLERGWI